MKKRTKILFLLPLVSMIGIALFWRLWFVNMEYIPETQFFLPLTNLENVFISRLWDILFFPVWVFLVFLFLTRRRAENELWASEELIYFLVCSTIFGFIWVALVPEEGNFSLITQVIGPLGFILVSVFLLFSLYDPEGAVKSVCLLSLGAGFGTGFVVGFLPSLLIGLFVFWCALVGIGLGGLLFVAKELKKIQKELRKILKIKEKKN